MLTKPQENTGLEQWFSSRDSFIPRGHWQCLQTLLVFVTMRRDVLLAPSGYEPGMLLSVLQGTGQPPKQSIIYSKMSIMSRSQLD